MNVSVSWCETPHVLLVRQKQEHSIVPRVSDNPRNLSSVVGVVGRARTCVVDGAVQRHRAGDNVLSHGARCQRASPLSRVGLGSI